MCYNKIQIKYLQKVWQPDNQNLKYMSVSQVPEKKKDENEE